MSKTIFATDLDRYGKKLKGKHIKSGECIIPFYYKDKLYFLNK